MSNHLRTTERVLKALANGRRLAIIKYLHSRPRASVGDIAEHIKLSFKATSKHLAILASAEIVERAQVSTVMQYSLQSPLHPLVKSALAVLSA